MSATFFPFSPLALLFRIFKPSNFLRPTEKEAHTHYLLPLYTFALVSLKQTEWVGEEKVIKVWKRKVLRKVETFPWGQFHKALFKLKLSIKGKDESCFHHVKILKIRPLLVRVRKRPFCWIFLSPFVIKKWSFLLFSQLIHYGF